MAIADRKPTLRTLSDERRSFQQVTVNLLGRYMLENRREFPCQVVDMSPGGMTLIAPVSGHEGERVVAYVDRIGRLEGVITRLFENGFAMDFATSDRKRDKLASQLAALANRDRRGTPPARRDD
jgi:hypothetical protein